MAPSKCPSCRPGEYCPVCGRYNREVSRTQDSSTLPHLVFEELKEYLENEFVDTVLERMTQTLDRSVIDEQVQRLRGEMAPVVRQQLMSDERAKIRADLLIPVKQELAREIDTQRERIRTELIADVRAELKRELLDDVRDELKRELVAKLYA